MPDDELELVKLLDDDESPVEFELELDDGAPDMVEPDALAADDDVELELEEVVPVAEPVVLDTEVELELELVPL